MNSIPMLPRVSPVFWRVLLALIAVLCAGSCSKQEPTPIRVGSVMWPGFETFFVAREKGFLDSSQAKLVEYTSTSEVIRAYRNGSLDGSLATLDEALLISQEVPDIRIVLVTDISHGADVVFAKPGIASLKELKGHKIGAETGALGAFVLMRALEAGGLSREDVSIVPLEPTEHETAFKQGVVDAVVTYEPMRTKLRAAGAREIFDSSMIPGQIVDLLLVRDSAWRAHPEAVKHLVQGFYRAHALVTSRSAEAARIAAAREHTTPEEYLASLELMRLPDAAETRSLLTGPHPRLLENAKVLSQVMMDQKLLSQPVDPRPLFHEEMLQSVLP